MNCLATDVWSPLWFSGQHTRRCQHADDNERGNWSDHPPWIQGAGSPHPGSESAHPSTGSLSGCLPCLYRCGCRSWKGKENWYVCEFCLAAKRSEAAERFCNKQITWKYKRSPSSYEFLLSFISFNAWCRLSLAKNLSWILLEINIGGDVCLLLPASQSCHSHDWLLFLSVLVLLSGWCKVWLPRCLQCHGDAANRQESCGERTHGSTCWDAAI